MLTCCLENACERWYVTLLKSIKTLFYTFFWEKVRHASSPLLIAEALALRWTITIALSQGYHSICFNRDCKLLLAEISSKFPPTDLFGIIHDIEHISLSFTSVSFKFIARLLNTLPDHLAKAILCTATSIPP